MMMDSDITCLGELFMIPPDDMMRRNRGAFFRRKNMSDKIQFKTGKSPARPGAVSMKLSAYLSKPQLPVPPADFGHYDLISNYGMLGNDDFGDCVWAGAAHETMMWCKEVDSTVSFNDTGVLGDYTKVTGFDASDPSTDNGTDMQVAASYRRKT